MQVMEKIPTYIVAKAVKEQVISLSETASEIENKLNNWIHKVYPNLINSEIEKSVQRAKDIASGVEDLAQDVLDGFSDAGDAIEDGFAEVGDFLEDLFG